MLAGPAFAGALTDIDLTTSTIKLPSSGFSMPVSSLETVPGTVPATGVNGANGIYVYGGSGNCPHRVL